MYLHETTDFKDLISIVAAELGILPELVEKDYWIIHCLFCMQQMGLKCELKGGTSLSKGYKIIERFSEDIDIRIDPACAPFEVKTEKNHKKKPHQETRRKFYDWLASEIKIEGAIAIERDLNFDDDQYRSGGIRIYYPSMFQSNATLKEGVLLELGFDQTTPCETVEFMSWVGDMAIKNGVEHKHGRSFAVCCYQMGYTLVEKLQAISTKFRQQQDSGQFSQNFLRHYSDVYHLLGQPEVQNFIGTGPYYVKKDERFRNGDEKDLTKNEAFLLSSDEIFERYEQKYMSERSLYYGEQTGLREIISRVQEHAHKL